MVFMPTRICRGCGVERDCETGFYNGSGRKDGKRSKCKTCYSADNAEWVKKSGWTRPAAVNRIFTCVRCDSEFHRPTNAGSKKLCDTCGKVGRICGRCNEFKPNDRFYQFKTTAKGSRFCLDGCARANFRERLYGIPKGTIDEALKQFGGKCGICGATESSGGKKELHIDHCHESGKIRGLLCNHCNLGIGHFRDQPELLMAAIAYLKQHAAV